MYKKISLKPIPGTNLWQACWVNGLRGFWGVHLHIWLQGIVSNSSFFYEQLTFKTTLLITFCIKYVFSGVLFWSIFSRSLIWNSSVARLGATGWKLQDGVYRQGWMEVSSLQQQSETNQEPPQETSRSRPGLHKLWYPGIRDTSTWSKFGAHGEHGDVFLFSNLGALWFSENLISYSLHVCLREVKNNLFSFKHSYLRHFSWRF